jgi:hypothetical protein
VFGDKKKKLGYCEIDISQFATEEERVKKTLKMALIDCVDPKGSLTFVIIIKNLDYKVRNEENKEFRD